MRYPHAVTFGQVMLRLHQGVGLSGLRQSVRVASAIASVVLVNTTGVWANGHGDHVLLLVSRRNHAT